MHWLLVTSCLVYCFTVALTFRYKEEVLECREELLEEKEHFTIELRKLRDENAELKTKLYNRKKD